MGDSVRIDKWLWSVRVYKTRGLATEACQKGHVSIDGIIVKPSRQPKPGDIIRVRKPPIHRSYKVLAMLEKRVGAAEVGRYMEEVTPQEELALLETQKHMTWISRDRGTGRPTKKERRDIDDFFSSSFTGE